MGIDKKHHKVICTEYELGLVPMIDLAKRYGVTRQAIRKLLKRYGIDTSKRKLTCVCANCGEEIRRHRSRIRKTTRQFCDQLCYGTWLRNFLGVNFVEDRNGGRIGRSKVSEHFDLQPEHIVHHEDRNQGNNELYNLRVFANQSDHMRYHRNGYSSVAFLWSGDALG